MFPFIGDDEWNLLQMSQVDRNKWVTFEISDNLYRVAKLRVFARLAVSMITNLRNKWLLSLFGHNIVRDVEYIW